VVTLTAVDDGASVFTGWSGAGCSGTGTCVVTMNSAHTVTATFAAKYTLTVVEPGTNTGTGTVTTGGGEISCPGVNCSALFAPGANVTLHAAPDADSTFSNWSGGGCSGSGDCSLTMNASHTTNAVFTLVTWAVTVTNTSAGGTGTVTSTPAGITCGATCSASFNQASTVTLTAAVTTGSFTGWTGDCASFGTSLTCTLTMDAAKAATATFGP
jgi:hypothetical protein